MIDHRGKHRRRRPWRPALILAAALLATGDTRAQQQPGGDLTQLPLEQLMHIDVVNGASRHDQKVTEAPSSVSIITASEIARFGYRTLADALRSVHGFYTTYDRNYTYLGVRGFSRPSDYNSRFLLLIDGHRVNDNFYGSAYIGTEAIIDIEQVERIEVIRGPSSSLYGAGAFFAVINVISRKQTGQPGVQMTLTGASYGTPAARLGLSREFDSGWSVQGSASGYQSHGQDLFFKEYDAPLTNNGVFENGDGDRAYRAFSTATRKNLTLQAAFSYREKDIPTGAFGTPFDETGTQTLDERSYFDAKYERDLSDRTSIMTRASLDRYYYRGDYPYYSSYPTILLYREHSWGSWLGTEAKLTFRPDTRQTITTGLEYRNNLKQHFRWQNVTPGPVDFDDAKRSDEGGLYVQDEVSLPGKVSLNVGVRHDQYQTFGGNTNPRAAVIVQPREHTTLKALYGSAFRAPTVYELYYGSHANPDLNPETIKTYELVFEQYARGGLRFSTSAYSYSIHDLVSVNTVSNQFENLSSVKANGLELEVDKRFRSGLSLRYSSTLEEARDGNTDALLTNAPRHLAKLNTEIPIHGERLAAGAEAQYVSRRLTLSGQGVPQYAIVNLTLLSRQPMKGMTISASVYNLFDTSYQDPASEHHLQDALPQDGRNVRLMLTWGF